MTAILIAWKVRLAGWPRPKRSDGGIAALIAETSSAGGLDRPALGDLARDRAGPALLAQFADHLGESVLRPLVDHGGRREALRRVHPHVEWRVIGVGEAPLPGVDLHRGHAEVEDDPVGPDALPAQALEGGDEVGAQEAGSRRGIGGELAPALLRGRVAIDRDQLALGADPLRDQAGVAAAAEGAVHERLARAGVEDVDQLGGEDGIVFDGHIGKVR